MFMTVNEQIELRSRIVLYRLPRNSVFFFAIFIAIYFLQFVLHALMNKIKPINVSKDFFADCLCELFLREEVSKQPRSQGPLSTSRKILSRGRERTLGTRLVSKAFFR